MDFVTTGFILGFALIFITTIWNVLVQSQGKKEPGKLFNYFVKKYGFTTNEQATLFNGIYEERNIQLKDKPPAILIPMHNPKSIKLHISTTKTDENIPELAPVQGIDIAAYSNYPKIAQDVLQDELVHLLNHVTKANYDLEKSLQVHWSGKINKKEFEALISASILLAQGIENFSANE